MDGLRNKSTTSQRADSLDSLKIMGVIELPHAAGSSFDHGIFDPKTGRVFIAHTERSTVEVVDPTAARHIATLPDFPAVAGAVADDGEILTTNRGAATITWLDAETYRIKGVFPSGPRPNGAAIVKRKSIAIAACIGDVDQGPVLQLINLKDITQRSVELPGRPRWCVTDAAAERLFLCIREPSMILVVNLPDLRFHAQWRLPSGGAHGLDIAHARQRLYAACDAGDLVEVDSRTGEITEVWPIAGPPDVTFFNPVTGNVHVAIGEPGLVETINPVSGMRKRTVTGADAHTTVLVPPDLLYVISPAHGGVLVLADS